MSNIDISSNVPFQSMIYFVLIDFVLIVINLIDLLDLLYFNLFYIFTYR